jgi:polar amino acid transport system ATP-binding protein
VVLMDDSRIIETGTPAEIMTRPRHARTRHFLRTVLGAAA